jgi:hypothetical protein
MADRQYHGDDRRNPDHLREIIREEMREANKQLLLAIGINPDHPLEAQADMTFLRSMRERCEKVGLAGAGAIITVVVGGTLSALWLGIKASVGK